MGAGCNCVRLQPAFRRFRVPEAGFGDARSARRTEIFNGY